MSFALTVLPDAQAVGDAVADKIADAIAAANTVDSPPAAKPFLLGCPTGRTPTPVYQALARLVAERSIDLSRVIIVLMDEYLVPGPGGEVRPADPARSYSCVGFAKREIAGPLNAAAARAGVGPVADIWAADPNHPEEYDARIIAAGGIDIFILASGQSDGHIAFNQPGTDRESITHIANLGAATRTDNMSTFPEFTSLDQVPKQGITVGISTIIELSKKVIMIVTGKDKQLAFQRLTHATSYEPDWPATAFVEGRNPELFADAAAAQTERINNG